MRNIKFLISNGLMIFGLLAAYNAQAIVVTATQDTTVLTNAILGAGITPTSVVLSGNSNSSGQSSGTYTNASGTYGIGAGVVLSSGDVQDYGDGPNTQSGHTTSYGVAATGAQELLLDPITGGSLNHNDVTQLDIIFDVDANTNSIFFNVVFGSDEFSEYIGSSYIDAFGIYLNGVNIAIFNGDPINIDHPNMAFIPGTELDGILDSDGPGSVMKFSSAVTAGSVDNTLTFIIADSGDSVLDSTVYISGFGNVAPPDPTQAPIPGTLALVFLGLLGFRVFHKNQSRS